MRKRKRLDGHASPRRRDTAADAKATTAHAAPFASSSAGRDAAPTPRPYRILVVEDNELNQKVAVSMLEKLGYAADVAANGRRALEALVESHFDLILMDCQMPEMNGFQAAERIRQVEQASPLAPVPIIAMTANAMNGARDLCLRAGMNDYLPKPVTLESMRAILERWLPRVS